MEVCLICSNKDEELFLKQYTKFDIKYLLSTYAASPESNLTIDNVLIISALSDTFVIAKTAECRSDFIFEILLNLISRNKKVINFHDFSDMDSDQLALLKECGKVEPSLINVGKFEFTLPQIQKPLVLINSILPTMYKSSLAYNINKYFCEYNLKSCIFSSEPYDRFVEKTNNVFIPYGDFEFMINLLIDQFSCVQDSDIILMIYPFELLSKHGSYNIIKEFYNSLINRWKVDYLITLIPTSVDIIQLEKIDSQNLLASNKKADCFVSVNSVFDPLDYNVKKPCDFMSVKNIETKIVFPYYNERLSLYDLFDDIIKKLQ